MVISYLILLILLTLVFTQASIENDKLFKDVKKQNILLDITLTTLIINSVSTLIFSIIESFLPKYTKKDKIEKIHQVKVIEEKNIESSKKKSKKNKSNKQLRSLSVTEQNIQLSKLLDSNYQFKEDMKYQTVQIVLNIVSFIGTQSNLESLKQISLSTNIICKSTKVFFVYLGASVFRGKAIHTFEIISILMMIQGIMLQNYDKIQATSQSSSDQLAQEMHGYTYIIVNLFCDVMIAQINDYMKENQGKIDMFNSTVLILFMMLSVFTYKLSQGEQQLGEQIAFQTMNDNHYLVKSLTVAGSTGAGILLIQISLNVLGNVSTSMITTIRKLASALFAIMFSNETMNQYKWSGVSLVFLALTMDMFKKNQSDHKAKNV